MRKYYCPYCGEKVLTVNQKVSRPIIEYSIFSKELNRVRLSCKHCYNMVDHKMRAEGDKYDTISYYLILLSFFIDGFIFFKTNSVFWLISFIVFETIFFGVVDFIIQLKYCLFVRKEGNYKDVFLNAKVDFFDEFDFCEDAIYCFRPPAEYTQLINMKKEYILAISQCNKEDNTCKLRVIKPEVTQIKGGITFDVYDDKKHIGTSIFI